ncbi:DNA mismatch repair protein MutS [Acidithiobacillus thiooxidans]|uniref:DNA mismatch repair proteins mutS family domain-containing protein n=1 Tax=Acidithiobacillus thiooxidans TaxID=930 RepID=A0A1C2IGM4_ACITH|nr:MULTISPECIES: hypothetical protein [Acidithiobacillus]MBU2742319.1 DNA mismatch repair protein MutS [Acidithiobacillus albertensis]MBU2836732.1 DNA mismatch repair protein MutS [Acidithiobacillus thiooxidans]MDA8177249.1 hypothetical protein [Acidithiobacillus sp.]OCX75137.1 hypothetical protein A6M23_03530 [Acidithiobacillus thiooxidans]OCX77714.1 hypothetical protein A6P08_20905 [Acidithiobacillus thiooxidans]
MNKISLLYPDNRIYDFNTIPDHSEQLIADLELSVLFSVMANQDEKILEAVRKILLGQRSNEKSVILFRQQILKDFMRHPLLVSEIYQLSLDTLEAYRDSLRFWLSAKSASRRLRTNVELMDMLLAQLIKIRNLSTQYADAESTGLQSFFKFLQTDFSDEVLNKLRLQNSVLRFNHGFSVNARLDHNNRSSEFLLNREQPSTSWLHKIFSSNSSTEEYSFTISQRDESGLTALSEFRDAALESVALIMDVAVQQFLNFFSRLRDESAFYQAALNLCAALKNRGYVFCLPTPLSGQNPVCVASKLYDPCLALLQQEKLILNDLQAENKSFILITGANSGGKSTFLRALGVNQLLLQSGFPVAAEQFSASLCDEVYTHFKLEEDTNMRSGKFDEELLRMAALVPKLKATAMVLFNESFAATNEREGSEIAWQICNALLEKGIKVVFVTHLYAFARKLYAKKSPEVLPLRVASNEESNKKFTVSEAEPLSTSFAKEIYQKVFAD